MDIFALIIILLGLFALSVIISYFIYDYTKYKGVVTASINDSINEIKKEQTDRISNLKYVVDQVNNINNDIYNFTSSNTDMIVNKENTINENNNKVISGLNTIFNITDGNNQKMPFISFSNMPCVGSTNVNFMKHINAVSGMTIKDVNKNDNSFEVCSASDSSRCIKFPDKDGNTLITNLDPRGDLVLQNKNVNQNIVMDGNLLANNIELKPKSGNNPSYIKSMNPNGLVIAANGDVVQGTINGNYITLGNSVGIFGNKSVSIGTTQNNRGQLSLLVDNGGINTFKPINIYSSDGLRSIATISLSNQDLVIKSPNRIIFDAGKGIKTVGNSETDILTVRKELRGELPQGPRGSQGSQGIQGILGEKGPQGDRGFQGSQGNPGINGTPGNQGPTGYRGEVGPVGPQGLQGSVGIPMIGVRGSQGPQGPVGLQGSQGLRGATDTRQGPLGSQGPQGSQGLIGSSVRGSQGIQGSMGSMGSQGIQGSMGSRGSQGIQGSMGSRGSTQQGSMGSRGDKGSQGIQGEQGSQGSIFQGSRGIQGSMGSMGSQGIQGSTGSRGVQGSRGPRGSQGEMGSRGDGIAGSQGPPGPMGPQGSQGTQGPMGITIDMNW